MARITNDEIETTIEMFVNSIYDEGDESGWMTASYDKWVDAVYCELTMNKTIGGCSYRSNENRFVGKENIIRKIKPLLTKRLTELKAEGYNISAIEESK